MKIAFNPSTVEALIAPPNNKDITFDLRGHNIFARGVKFCGTDTWRPVVDNLTSDSTTSSLSAKQGKILKSLIDGKSNSGHTHDDRYLKLTGGTMASNALITFADSGSWGTDKGPQGARGGLYWSGQSDYAKLYAEETAGDNLDLVIQFGDDNSNGLSIRNASNIQTSYISAGGVITTKTFKGNLDWSYITNKPSSYTPSAHTHAWNSLTHSSTTENQAILTNGKANGWKLYTLNISRWDNAANNAHSHSNKSVLDGITSALVNNWNTAFTFVNTITGTDTDKIINKWDEIVNFLAGITEDNKLNTLLNSKLSIQQLSTKDILTTKTNNALFWVNTKGTASSITTGPFTDHPYALLSVTNYNQNAENNKFFYRSRLAFSSAGDIKVASCHHENEYKQDETWYNVLTSKNSGINGSTIKLNGTSITVYSSSTADGRYVKKSGDTMTGTLTTVTTGSNSYNQGIRINRTATNQWATLLIGKSGIATTGTGTSTAGDGAWLIATPASSNSLIFNLNSASETVGLCLKGHGNTDIKWNNNTIWHAGNDGSGSGLDADTVDGYHASNFSYTHQTSFDFSKSKSGRIVTFDQSDTDYGWINGFASTHNNYLTSVLFNAHRTSNWYVGYIEGNTSTGLTNGLQAVHKLAFVDQIPTSLKNPHALTISLNGTSQGPYDGSAAKNINITPGSIGAATSGHNHDGRYVYNYGGTQMDGASINKNALGMTTNSGITGDWWHILQAAWNGEYRWNSQIAFPTQNRNGMYYRSGLDDNTKWGAWVKLLDVNNYSSTLDSRYYTESESDSRFVNITGDTMTGTLTLANSSVTSGTDTTELFRIYSNTGYKNGLSIFSIDNKTYINAKPYGSGTANALYLRTYNSGVINALTLAANGNATFIGSVTASSFIGNASSATTLQTARNLWGNSFNGTADISGTIKFNNVTSGLCEGIQWTCGDNDQARIKAGATGSNAGYLEIATADDGSEPIYVRQYTGVFSSVKRTLTLLDANGYTHFPGYINIGGNENNNSSPDRVWGSNSSDSYLRSYRTSALRVAHANTSGQSWNVPIQGQHWSRLYTGIPNIIHHSSIFSISGSIGCVVFCQTFLVESNHPGNATIICLSSGSYTQPKMRALAKSDGTVLVDLFWSGSDCSQSSSTQQMTINVIANALQGSISPITTLTNDDTIPSGYSNTCEFQCASKTSNFYNVSLHTLYANSITVNHEGSAGIYLYSSSGESSYSMQAKNGKRWAAGAYTDRYFIWNDTVGAQFNITNSGNVGIGITSPSYKLHVAGDIYTTTGFKKNGSSDNYVLLGGGGHKIISDFMLKKDELSNNLTTISKSLTVTQAWMDTGIKYTDLPANGTYIIQVSANNTADGIWSNYWSGIMSWYKDGTNDSETDEIILHRAGHAYHHTIYLRTIMTTSSDGRHLRLQIAADINLSTAVTYTFKFKRVI